MDEFYYAVKVDDDMRDECFSIFSYDKRKGVKNLKPEDYLPITMKVESCKSFNSTQGTNILNLVTVDGNQDQGAMEDFCRHYTDALYTQSDDWILVAVRKIEIDIMLIFYSRKLNKRQILTLDVRSRDVEELNITFEVPHKDNRPSTLYKWQISRREPGSYIESEITTIYKILPDSEKLICYAEGDDDISITEYTDLP